MLLAVLIESAAEFAFVHIVQVRNVPQSHAMLE
jgi:hypothetical protein